MTTRSLRIAHVAPLWAAVPPSTYGGMELMSSLLTEELVARGHDVTLFASGDSATAARLEYVAETNLLDAINEGRAGDYEYYINAHFAKVLGESGAYDLVHVQGSTGQLAYADLSAAPMIFTLRTVLSGDDAWLLGRHPDVQAVAISRAQIAPIPAERRRTIRVIHNGVDFGAYQPSTPPGSYLVFLGRFTPRKGPIEAIEIARTVGLPIVLAGGPQTGKDRRWFDAEVAPLIDDTNVRYVGPVDHTAKNDLLRGASALLFPIDWEEPFGNVMIEAMACGTPVIATRRGSVPEVVDSGTTGYIGDDPQALAELVEPALALDRRVVRDHAEARFSHRVMADAYEALYRELV